MDEQTIWIIAAAAALLAGLAGFYIGRSRPDPATHAAEARIQALEAEIGQRKAELDRKQAELDGYRGAVDTHFDKTATLFVEMAGSYRNLFQHLSSDYERLSSGSDGERFKARISALLLEGERTVAPADGVDPQKGSPFDQSATDPSEPDPQGSASRARSPQGSKPGGA